MSHCLTINSTNHVHLYSIAQTYPFISDSKIGRLPNLQANKPKKVPKFSQKSPLQEARVLMTEPYELILTQGVVGGFQLTVVVLL